MVISLGQGYEFAVPNCREEMWVKVCPSAPTRVSAYAAALGIHYTVGYMSLVHLLPAFAGLGILLLGLGLSYSYLCGSPREQVAARAVTLPSS